MGPKLFISASGLLLLLVTQVLTAPPDRKTEQQVKQFVRQSSDEIFQYFNMIREGSFPTDYGFFEGVIQLAFYQEMCKRISDIAKEARVYQQERFSDVELVKELQILSDSGLLALEDNYFGKFLVNIVALEQLATEEVICSYNNKEYCELSYVPDIRRILSQSHDAHELQYYWEEWRNKQSPSAKQYLQEYIELYKNASYLNGKTPIDLWFTNYEDSNFLADMEDVMKQLKPFYTEFHAYVRYVLNRKYGELVVPADGPIPHHLIEQVLIQAWKKNSLLEQPFPDKKLPNLKEQLDQHGLNARRMVEVADDFFRSMGFPPLPETFWRNSTKPKTKEEAGTDCKSEVFDATPNVALKYCPKSNFKKFLQIHGDIARLHYSVQKKDLPFTFFDSYDFEFAVGEATILSASTPRHIQRIGLLRNYRYDDQLSMNRLFRLGIHTMFNIPLHFVHSKIMAEVLSGKVEFSMINKRYWELMEEHAGIEPPSNRLLSHIDFPYKFYEGMEENHQTKKFVNEILGYQFYRALCKVSGGYSRGNANLPLQNCDFYGSFEAGEALRRMMSLGSKKPWKQVLGEIIEDEPDLNGAALLEFYEPLRNWLEAQNNLNNVHKGWTHSKHTIM